MNRLILVLLVLGAAFAAAQDATVTYVDGDVTVRPESGSQFPADFGTNLSGGDRIVTARRSEAELRLAAGGSVTVAPGTVFLVGSARTAAGEPVGRVAAAVGTFTFKFTAVTGNEPRIGSTTSVAGVRGTEVRVYVASDGTTRYEVVEGLLEIEHDGARVALGPDQAVEVVPGRPPGEVFSFLMRPIDYSIWNGELIREFLADPVPAIRGIATEMAALTGEISRRAPEWEALRAAAETAAVRLAELRESEELEAAQKFYLETVLPAQRAARLEFVSLRYVVLSALSLDQYIVSRLAAEMEAAWFMNPGTEVYRLFRSELAALRSRFEAVVVPFLVSSDL